MASRLQGYSYDVFISYRQKDNLPPDKDSPGWVSEFVTRLKKEIQSTIKEEINIYFDENPTDGILPTHDVDDTVKDKINCLVLIPVVSQIYCDPRSFAWNNEFLAFKSFINADPFGPKVKLLNGNIASRILPVCIHELDSHDRSMIESEIGPLRSVDFVFRSRGVNRPLTPSDKREDSSARILYKDQVNQVANAIRDIILAMAVSPEERKEFTSPKRQLDSKRARPPAAFIVGIIILFILGASIAIYFRTKNDTPTIDKSIAVLPFVDMTSSQDLEYFGDGIAEEIINSLTTIRDLRIVGRTSSFQFKGEKLDLREIGKKLNVSTILEGSIQQSGNKMRITAQLIRTSDNSHIWASRYDVEKTDIFKIQDDIASSIVKMLNLTLSAVEQGRLVKKGTTEEAYTIYLKGLFQYKKENYVHSRILFEEVTALDSVYAPAHAYLALSKAWIAIRERSSKDDTTTLDAIRSAQTATRLDPLMPEGYSCLALVAWAIERDFVKARNYFEKSLELDPGSSLIKNRYCYFLTWMGEFDRATLLAKEAMSIDPVDYNSYMILYNVNFYSEKFTTARIYKNDLVNIVGMTSRMTSLEIELSFYDGNFEKVNSLCDSLLNAGNELAESDLSYNAMAYFALHQWEKSNDHLGHLTEGTNEKRSNSNFLAARVYAFRRQPDSVFSRLNKAVKKRENLLNRLKIDHAFKDQRTDPRYIELYDHLGFNRY
jgi:adenylate cyclase